MKRCPRCGQTYTDPDINFCLNDGELLSRQTDTPFRSPFPDEQTAARLDDSPPTVILDQSRVTNPTGWNPPSSPPVRWQQPQNQIVYPYNLTATPNQTLAIISLCLGLGSLTVGWCCSMGLLFGPAAMITGFIALAQNKKDPQSFGGKGLAIGGVATGGIFIVIYVIIMLLYGLSIFFGSI